MSFIIVAGAMVFVMIPGLAFLYSGLSRRKNALSLMWAVVASNAVVIFQWFFWGYSLAFSTSAHNGFIGNLRNFGLMKVFGGPSPGSPLIPAILYSFFQMEFGCVTAGILMGGIAERGRVFPAMVFIFCWMTLVYCPLACWIWSVDGWAMKWGVLDFAGGGPVEIGSGVSGLAFSWVLGRRQQKELLNFRPHNVSLVVLGTSLLWFGWLGFNGGSAFGANLRAVFAIWNSMLAASFGGMVWCLLDYRYERRWTMVGFCSGTIAGLVAATPSSGYLHPWSSVVTGVLSGTLCNLATKVKHLIHIDDALDLFAEHAVGGIVGLIINAFFADEDIIVLDGVSTTVRGGFMNHNWSLIYKQICYVLATCGYSFVVTALIAKAVDMLPGLHLRAGPTSEALGMDEVEHGEFATDYIELRRDFTAAPFITYESNDKTYTNGHPSAAGDRHGQPDTSLHDTVGDEDAPIEQGRISEKTEHHGASSSTSHTT
ncbi:ammonium transporter [Macrolepiota fuliginosa MF-IS2]|uniref:Ammonium transporter n=1 Tax=Macrolepiota fuliginosa MF-IS2 TaxID=1400762 RepID=A0A9P5XQC2_9AGAR|nr:ammonium transporter [Macrolepiota fuliginosa MF-IS2]